MISLLTLGPRRTLYARITLIPFGSRRPLRAWFALESGRAMESGLTFLTLRTWCSL